MAVIIAVGQALASEPSARVAEARQEPTGLPLSTLQWVGRSICADVPEFARHPEVESLFESRLCAPLCAPQSYTLSLFF
jgi:hypothetical protein